MVTNNRLSSQVIHLPNCLRGPSHGFFAPSREKHSARLPGLCRPLIILNALVIAADPRFQVLCWLKAQTNNRKAWSTSLGMRTPFGRPIAIEQNSRYFISRNERNCPMAETKKENAAPSTGKATRVIDYIVQRLADEGITDCFGVPGDYAFPVNDAVDRNPNIRWVGCSNELNASYAADGYARVRGAAMLSTTYAVGELSAINGVMGAKAERSLVYHVVGMPSYQNQRVHKILHHTFGDGVFGNFVNISAQAACSYAVIDPDNCMIEMERVISEARRNNQPAYIVVPGDHALAPVTPTDVRPVTLKSNEASLEKAVAAIAERVRAAKSMVAFPAFTVQRLRLQK